MENNLKSIRESRGMSQDRLGALINKTGNTIGNWEAGRSSMKASDVYPVCRALDCTPNELFGWDAPRAERAAIDLTDTERAVIAAMRDGEKEKGIRRDQRREGVA